MGHHDELRAKLEARLKELLERGEKVEGNLRRSRNPLDSNWTEAAVTKENDEVLEGIDAEIATEMRQLQSAINRIETGTYGLCEHCGETIPPARLEALPHASACVECARAHE